MAGSRSPLYLCLLLFAVVDRSLASVAAGPVIVDDAQPRTFSPDVYKKAFEDFKLRYDKHYESPESESAHFDAFMDNYDLVEAHRSKNASYTLEINAFSDQTPEEFSRTYRTFRPGNVSEEGLLLEAHEYSGESLPDSVDWRSRGAASHVKNQQRCGGCWAFAAIAALEGAWYIATDKKQSLSLSEQQLIDCVHSASGCGGGDFVAAFQFMRVHPVCTEGSYDFVTTQGQSHACKQQSCTEAIPEGGVTGAVPVKQFDPASLMEAVAKQPVAVAIDAGGAAFSQYSKGVWDNCGTNIDHAVLLVGYGSDDGGDYWLIQNSWGDDWGDGGFGKIRRSSETNEGTCGILMHASYVTVDGSKALPSMNNVSRMQLFIIAGICCLICVVVSGIGYCICTAVKSRRTRTVPIVLAQPISIPQMPVVVAQNIAAATSNGGKMGNSRQSRLVQ